MEKILGQSARAKITLLLCFAIAIFEGFDLQSMGVAAPRMRAEFMLDNGQMAWAFSAAILGTLPGAILGGRFADIVGRKKILIFSILLFGIMSLLTAYAANFSLLLLIRFCTGLGMGGALPMMITLASEAVPDKYKGTAVSIMYSGIPFGGLLTSVVAMSLAGDAEWRHIFYIGGIAPILLIPLIMRFYLSQMITCNVKVKRKNDAIFGSFICERTSYVDHSALGQFSVRSLYCISC